MLYLHGVHGPQQRVQATGADLEVILHHQHVLTRLVHRQQAGDDVARLLPRLQVRAQVLQCEMT